VVVAAAAATTIIITENHNFEQMILNFLQEN
jgi:hypothetical protein